MIITEVAALEKECPQKMIAAGRIDRRCIGSACMAWRPYDGDKGYCGAASMPAQVQADLQAVTRMELIKAQKAEREEAQAAFFAMTQGGMPRGPVS